MTPEETQAFRRANLVFALQASGRPRSHAWVVNNVDGYQGVSTRTISRDVAAIRKAGVPLHNDDGMLSITKDRYELNPIDFTPEEAAAVSVAGRMGYAGGLGAFAASGWTKLASAGAQGTVLDTAVPVLTAANDFARVDPELLAKISRTAAQRLRMTFSYRRTPTAAPEKRTMDPWGLVFLNGRIYLVGFDIDREDIRVFRALRIDDVAATRASTHPSPGGLDEIAAEVLASLHTGIDATVSVAAASARELFAGVDATWTGSIARLHNVDVEWLIRTAAAYAPELIVIRPQHIRDEVVSLLSASAAEEES